MRADLCEDTPKELRYYWLFFIRSDWSIFIRSDWSILLFCDWSYVDYVSALDWNLSALSV